MLSDEMLKLINDHLVFFNIRFRNIKVARKPTTEFIAQYQQTYPNYLFYIWDNLGFACFEDGGFWLVNPADYIDILNLCLKHTDFTNHDDFYVFGRSAYGNLYVMNKKTSSKLTIDIVNLRIYPNIDMHSSFDEMDHVKTFLATIVTRAKNEDIDIYDNNENFLFERCLANLGELKDHEIYAFEPPAVLGGQKMLENMKKANLFEYIPFVANLDNFQVMLDICKGLDRLEIKPIN
ncbi:aspartyl-tRNA amidotransferase subunit B [Acinetobacter gyllenbergii]|uniref:DUF1851 domain-containing protein n=1 Tax=Acinetobacter gyllenbergii CIP 110306 = MTCC 11365 TaxID=1217657 RepID=A0A829HB63_9GAMM|nr:GAD-like domain-containing protein [Acinetobacter gyllenbergii]EPF71654.1 hypothetical protein F957_03840 [Acinetobacter gyllenbergii CIP 110306 = MTCC 11365]EPH31213.1 hypothetical protein L293_2363 [Acinetobacter gyllenbergii CIP 110306 = MTCC 11365]GMA11814.1 aspartyl-tRNA amidotransferase subunit B [Acinetobacter gyllenbergii]